MEEISKVKIICLDTETTGLNRYLDEILQLSIIDGSGNILFSEYFKPVRHEKWDDSEKIHHIGPEMVRNCKPLLYYAHTIQHILEDADVIVGYNISGFDLPFIFNSGIEYNAKNDAVIVDVMLAFAKIYGQYSNRHHGYKWQKLQSCANYYSYDSGSWHDALDDAKATLFCFYKIFGDPPELLESATGICRAESNVIKCDDPIHDSPVTDSVPKSGLFMIAFGIFMLLGFFVAFNPVILIISVLFLFFGIRRHKKYKAHKQNKGKQ